MRRKYGYSGKSTRHINSDDTECQRKHAVCDAIESAVGPAEMFGAGVAKCSPRNALTGEEDCVVSIRNPYAVF